MLTKEECVKARDVIYSYINTDEMLTDELNDSVVIYNELIKEHFELVKDFMQLDKYFVQLEKSYDNLYDKFHNLKPLNFENLHDFMPVFDVKTGFWIMITSVTNGDSFGGYVFNKKDATLCFNLFTFEENRFYQREVNDYE